MTTEQWHRVRSLFESAVDDPPADVDRWLIERCDDAEVRKEATSLLLHHSKVGDFLASPAGDLSEILEDDDDSGLRPGRALGAYQIVSEIGRGGMGRVYRAVDGRLNRTVAIKALPVDLAPDPSRRERLRREARAAATLSHPGICTVHALEEIDGDLYIVTEFIEGQTLRHEIQHGGRATASQIVDTARQLAAALGSAHAAGVIHRDLKPENVMRTLDGRIKILDFGLARIEHTGSPVSALMTQPGAVMGTPAYMAPEQLTGAPVDARTDVFSFGVLIYEYATGVHPFDAATTIARAGRVLEGTPDPIGRRRPDLPGVFTAAIDRCLQKAPSDRFASAAEIARALAALESSAGNLQTLVASLQSPASSLHARRLSTWRVHQLIVIAFYLAAAALAWLAKEWRPGATSAVFIGLGIATAIVGVLRAHLVFTERTHGAGLDRERRRVEPVTLGLDLLIAAALAADGLAVAQSKEVAGVLILGVAIGIGLARLVLEPATIRAAFESDD